MSNTELKSVGDMCKEIKDLKARIDYCEGIMEEDEDLKERHRIDVSDLKEENKKLNGENKSLKDERISFGFAFMSVKDDIDEILYGDKDGCPYEHDYDKDHSTNLWDSWEVRIKSIKELKDASLEHHRDFLENEIEKLKEEKYSLYAKWAERGEKIEKLKEELANRVYDKQGAKDCFDLVDQEDIEELKEENKKLQEAVPWLRIVHKHLGDPPEFIRLKEENEKLKAENEQLNDDDWVIDNHKALKYKIVLTEEYYAELTQERDFFGKEIDKFKNKAAAWDIVNNGADWESLRDLFDEEMCRDLIKTGVCVEEDFEGYDYGR